METREKKPTAARTVRSGRRQLADQKRRDSPVGQRGEEVDGRWWRPCEEFGQWGMGSKMGGYPGEQEHLKVLERNQHQRRTSPDREPFAP